jgi:hypothetical protein
MNVLEMNNVELDEKLTKRVANEPDFKMAGVISILEPVVLRLATLNPLWRFVVFDYHYRFGGNCLASAFRVYDQGEEIGRIGRTHRGQTEVIAISHDRISNQRTRANAYMTADADKAILKAKKLFYKLKPDERMRDAMSKAQTVIDNQVHRKNRDKRDHTSRLRDVALEFISTDEGMLAFVGWVKTLTESQQAPIHKSMNEMARLSDELITIEDVRKKYGDSKAALVVRDGGKYLVRLLDNVQLYDDTTLPDEMKGKLGMLKLVEAEHFITNIGCRISDEVFVLLMNEEV